MYTFGQFWTKKTQKRILWYIVRSFGKDRYDREFRVLALTGRGNNLSNSRGMNLLRFGFIRQQLHDFFQNQIGTKDVSKY